MKFLTIILTIDVMSIIFLWNIPFYTRKDGKDVSVGKFILAMSLIIGGVWLTLSD